MTLPAPQALEINNANAVERWKNFCLAWTNYALPTELGSKPESVQVAMLLIQAGDEAQITPVLQKFDDYCQPKLNVPFERYRFNTRLQQPGKSYISIKQDFASWLKVTSQSHQTKYSMIALSSGMEIARSERDCCARQSSSCRKQMTYAVRQRLSGRKSCQMAAAPRPCPQ